MRFRKRDADRLEFAAVAAELAFARGFGQPIVDMFGEEFGRGVDAFEVRHVVEIAVVERPPKPP